MNSLDAWQVEAARALGVAGRWSEEDRDLVLDLARDVAHGVTRPAAPLTTYLAGLAVGAGLTPAEAAARITGLLAERGAASPTPPD